MPRPNQPGASINGRGDLKATKGTRFSDLLEPIHPQRKHDSDAIISLFPASRIRRLLISDPGPHRLCTMPCKTSNGKLKKRHILWYQSCHRMFSHSLFCVLRVWVCGGTHLAECNLLGSWFQLREGDCFSLLGTFSLGSWLLFKQWTHWLNGN